MKSSIPFLTALLTLALAAPLTAQTQPAAAVKTVEPVRLAYINSSAFLDEKAGIKQLVKVAQGLELEFSGTQSELSLLNEKLRTIVGELTKLNVDPKANAKAMAEQQAAGQKLQQELQGKQQAAQEAYNKRVQELQAPIAAEIGKEIRAFSKEHNIDLLLDLAKLGEAVLNAKPELDLTTDFVSFYNDRHK
ncbi:MAG: OmpH family outer membrane protein [Opitutaceae bacterium]|jgi:Skp family chaperone for outer membrane proteins|nr:OmpH family outer membrane protein [Opitutaceae bacterium]NBR57857.1 OmpH family outer membrane protein [Opitutaceae bacterium]